MKNEIDWDPGLGDPAASPGSEHWAKAWRLSAQSLMNGVDFDVKHFTQTMKKGMEYRVWTVLNREDGKKFKTFEEFVSYQQPWGLSQEDIPRFMRILEVELGKQAAQLETVAEPKQGKRNDLEEEDVTSPHGAEKQETSDTETRLRAINRAPDIVADLYREGLINQVEAAKLGRKDSNASVVAQEIEGAYKSTKGLPDKERRKRINEAARGLSGSKKKTPLEQAKHWIQKCSDSERESLKKWIG